MTDQERADRFVGNLVAEDVYDLDVPDAAAADLRRDLAEEFGTVRLDERRAVAVYCGRKAERLRGMGENILSGALELLAHAIEHGEHGS